MKTIYYITKTNEILCQDEQESLEILPLLEIKTLFCSEIWDKLKVCDSLIFTSANAVLALRENLESLPYTKEAMQRWRNLPNFTLGAGCNKALEDLGLRVFMSASRAYGDVFAKELVAHLQGKKPLFVRARKIASKLPQILRDSAISLQEAVLYESVQIKLAKSQKKPLKRDCVVFFSAPSHIEAFLLNFAWDSSYTALCIGATTQKRALELLGEKAKILISPILSKQGALEFAKTL
ncbi:uroporphyrinogen-III synthase [Helicobacter sp. MIT 05-5294]|uniref:uroporphyrinogen-III synthase n=1 Tax=Helicobacter sp. MIT 05-5294 TaxID=1548150 RepID=UPI00051FD873|nr:uroporphyrinogen-III synthase [Helicobacter sp. MIT 05-5294]TLD85709.1 uroporphyrinogen-III synthase [Helicobacter sp. MIT 05-5294]